MFYIPGNFAGVSKEPGSLQISHPHFRKGCVSHSDPWTLSGWSWCCNPWWTNNCKYSGGIVQLCSQKNDDHQPKEGPLRKQSIVLGFNIPQGNQPHPNHYKPLGLFKVPRKILEKISGKTLKSMNHLFIYLNTIYGKKRKSTVSCGIHWALPPQPLIVGNVECASPFAVSSSTTSDAANPSKTLNDLVWLRIQMGTGEPRT